MTETYKAGDRVILTGKYWGEQLRGEEAVISESSPSGYDYPYLRFSSPKEMADVSEAWYIFEGFEIEKVKDADMKIQVNDYIRAVHKTDAFAVEGAVTYDGVTMYEVAGRIGLGKYDYNFEVLERASELVETEPELPTEPGLYTLAKNEDQLVDRRIFALEEFGWVEPGAGDYDTEAVEQELKHGIKEYGWTLRKLTFEE